MRGQAGFRRQVQVGIPARVRGQVLVPRELEARGVVHEVVDPGGVLRVLRDLPVGEDWGAGAYVTVSLFRPGEGPETRLPQRAIGVKWLKVDPGERQLDVSLELPEKVRPGDTLRVTAEVMELSRTLGKIPVEANDYPGFVANRILMPMINEAIYALNEGVAGVEEIDTVMKLGMAHPMGPLQLADLIGLDVCLSILKVLFEGFGNPKYAPCPLLVNMVQANHLGVKTGSGFYLHSGASKELIGAPRFR